ncbi:MAG: CRTAC1 family protein [Planctomycetota bacterium]
MSSPFRRSWVLCAWAALAAPAASRAGDASVPSDLPTFTEVAEKAGISFKHSYGDRHLSNIVEGTGPGAVFFDFDGDGWLDLYLVNGCWHKDVSENMSRDLRGKLSNALYRNGGDGSFTDVTARARVGHDGYGMGACAADYDGDGNRDLYVLNYGPNVLYRNEGDGTFTDVSKESGLDDPAWSVSASWLDYDGDGDLDVYVGNYLDYDAGKFRDYYPAAGYPGPLSYTAQPDRLYRNNGDGTFTDITAQAGIRDLDGRAMSTVAADLNDDGLLDIYVTNDASPNFLFVAQGNGTFREEAALFGAAFGEGGQGASSMGPSVGDVDRDGRLDLYVPDMGYGCLLLNRGQMFIDATAPTNLALLSGQYTGWGGLLFDFDNDGWLDVFLATGDAHHEYTQECLLAWNDRKGRFIDVSDLAGSFFREEHVSRGAAYADYDDDGDIDVLVCVLNGKPKLLRNDGGNRKNWLKVVPLAPGKNIEALGARVTVTVGALRMVDEVYGTSGYLSQSDCRLHFGLGAAEKADRVEIRWPGGKTKVLEGVRANQTLRVSPDPAPDRKSETRS